MSSNKAKGPGIVKFFFGGVSLLLLFRLGQIVYNVLMLRVPDVFLTIPNEDILRRSEVSDTCSAAFEHVKTIEGVHSYAEVVKIVKASKNKEPIRFKGFIADPTAKWKKIESEHYDSMLSFTYLNLTGYGSMWTPGALPAERVD
eukprot:gene40665-49580_t